MALTSTFYDGVVTESDRAKNLAGSPVYGVYGPEDFKVAAHPSIPYAVLVKAGRAHGHGVTDTADEDQVVQCATIASGVRWDLIVVRRNWQPELGGPSTLEVIQAGAEPQIPAGRIVGPGVEDDQPIALVKWQGGISAPVQFIDLRVWAGNGGLYAKNDLVRQYIGTVGTEININGSEWVYRLGDNDSPGWAKVGELSRIPLFGANGRLDGPMNGEELIAGGASHFLIQAGSSVGYTDNSGFGRITFSKPFPNGLLTFIINNGDAYAAGSRVILTPEGNNAFWGSSGQGDRNSAVYEAFDFSTNGRRPNMLHRANWIAIGW